MKGLTLDDLLPLEEYAPRRKEFFHAHGRYLDQYRRVRVGPQVTLLFENRQTLWFRVQEVLRIARLEEPGRVQQELDVFNRLLPAQSRLQAALVIEIADEAHLVEELAPWHDLRGTDLLLRLGEVTYPANLFTCRPEDRTLGAAHWVQFVLNEDARYLLHNNRVPAQFAVTLPHYRYESAHLSDEVRQSLLDDLTLSDRD